MSLVAHEVGLFERLASRLDCDYPIVTGAPICRGVTSLITGRQKVALMLRKAGKDDAAIAQVMGIRRESANRLVNRAIRAEAAVRRRISEIIKER